MSRDRSAKLATQTQIILLTVLHQELVTFHNVGTKIPREHLIKGLGDMRHNGRDDRGVRVSSNTRLHVPFSLQDMDAS